MNDQPVPLFYGTIPRFRDLDTKGTVGRDVQMVSAKLRAWDRSLRPVPAAVGQGS